MDSADENGLELVKLDALVVMKIIKHCRENLPSLVTGQLLGLDFGPVLEVTNSFPFPGSTEDEEETEAQAEEGADYQFQMMRSLREVNVDSNTVGWYQSTYLGSFLNEAMIENQYAYQDTLKKSVVLVYDPLKTNSGHLSLQAFRLTDAFMALYKAGEFTQEKLIEFDIMSSDIFQEIPIQIHNPELVKAFLLDYGQTESKDCDFDRFDLSTNPFLEKNINFLSDCLDDLSQEQNKLQFYQRNLVRQQQQQKTFLEKRRAENAARKARGEEMLPEDEAALFKPIPPPSRLDSLLISNQIHSYCKNINQFAGESFTKLFLAGQLHETQ
eukprot:GILJ01001081.1.p1 GENE.GILJ01001081.1~~GILJ01001081.1.p1  ORF type:complete len:342 (+),score=57.84 GILJ01001081.1:46-1026(+)